MNRSAHVQSIGTITEFKLALQQYLDRVRQAATSLQLEVRRGVEWVEQERPSYWQSEVRRAADALAEARTNLQMQQFTVRPGEKPACYEHTKAVEKAQVRLRLAEAKVRTVRHWQQVLLKETEQMQSMLATLLDQVECDMPAAVATLQRLTTALDKYVARSSSGPRPADEIEPPAGDSDQTSQLRRSTGADADHGEG